MLISRMSGTQLLGVLLASVTILGRLVVGELRTGASWRLSLTIDLPVVFVMAFAIFLAVGQ
jgi:hypothetical protein